ncbi:sensor histidine kinase [Pseudohaliea rubra]|uniref:sensor histidine kinase n=1 Tax=Pseudohaliea rubra TaxID=475795 RepID=UPI00118676C7|nr:HAMP domain-containing sensor histidine kinase [Pseudohaliea rubra]
MIEGRARRIARRSPDAEPDLQALRLQVQRVEALVQDLLDYTGGAPRGRVDRFPARVLAETALQTLRQEAGDGAPRLTLAAGTGSDALLRADERRLELALLNILRNARQAAAGVVTLAVHGDGDGIVFEVRDDGPGLTAAPEVLLQPFWSSKPSGEGSGLGLAISAAIVEEHGGSLSLRNGDKGAIVTLRMPCDGGLAGGEL